MTIATTQGTDLRVLTKFAVLQWALVAVGASVVAQGAARLDVVSAEKGNCYGLSAFAMMIPSNASHRFRLGLLRLEFRLGL